ncbi:permease [Actinobacillus equuli subsp. haemolyticus]|uniref:Permease n=1 Tax=Actinobacillus equuli subsp. equuli TaxID=202947 RepID=A0A9X4JE59_ACTEU|nr:permease [Actinobacillus equuli]MDE8034815.1 permease [Actinobacillus equuli subsp. equuli]MDG4948973.1 permease [Actinobacillus equuli subsp. haemolyticus]WGE42616.1 permease [Actinobacillus equuli subsp. haemolyticus]WGE46961.1 permease [Actinobacillus equuli subsp. haemolyticus]WGE53316.1 permease [Actinobacillus equuli subsp. haemolyticus]
MSGMLNLDALNASQLEIVNTSAHIVGFIGMACVVLAFWFVVSERWKPTSLSYNILNGIGAVLLILSLCVHFNLGSFVIEVFWISISAMGIYKNLTRRKLAAA